MKDPGRILFIGILAVASFGCGGDESTAAGDVERTIGRDVTEATGTEASTSAEPCEVLDEALVRASFEIGPEVEIVRAPSKYSHDPLCTARWAKPNAEEIEQKRVELMTDYMTRKMKGEDVEKPAFRTQNEVSLTLTDKPAENPEQAMAMFDSAMRVLSEGFTSAHEGTEMTFQADLTPVEGVGRKAMWAPSLRQLSVVDGNQIFHVGVNTGAELEAELEKAKAIANEVAEEL